MSFHFDTVKSTEEQMASWTSHHRLTLFYIPIAGQCQKWPPPMYSSFSNGRSKNLFFIVKRKKVHKCVVAVQKLRAHWSADSFSSPKRSREINWRRGQSPYNAHRRHLALALQHIIHFCSLNEVEVSVYCWLLLECPFPPSIINPPASRYSGCGWLLGKLKPADTWLDIETHGRMYTSALPRSRTWWDWETFV